MFRLAKYVVSKHVTSPVYLIHFITNRCNAQCPHCFLPMEGERFALSRDLSIDELERVTQSFGPDLFNVNLTGGEPCLRDDLGEIISLYARNTRARSFLLATNGYFVDRIVRTATEAVRRHKDISLVVSLSVDHIGSRHDQLRKVAGLYHNVMETYRRLQELKGARVSTQIVVTLQHGNYQDIEAILRHLVEVEQITNLGVALTRGKASSGASGGIDDGAYRRANAMIEANLHRGALAGFTAPYLRILNAKNDIQRRMIERTLSGNAYIAPCYAGALTGVLCADGDVYPCELYDAKLGNVRDSQYDFSSIWAGEEARRIRQLIRAEKCFCTHECNWTTNILFNPRFLLPLTARVIAQSLCRKDPQP